MRVLVDINVLVDVLLARQPHVRGSYAIWLAVERGQAQGLISAHAITTLHYLLRRHFGNTRSKEAIRSLLRMFRVAPVDAGVIEDAMRLPIGDFEDAVSVAAAQTAGCQAIVTRDPKGFRASPIISYTPEAILPLFSGT